MVKGKKDKEWVHADADEASLAVESIVEEAGHSLGHQLIVVRDEAVPGAIDTFAAKPRASREAAEDLDNGIIHEAGQCVPRVGGLLHFICV
jgi:hypothetical protein